MTTAIALAWRFKGPLFVVLLLMVLGGYHVVKVKQAYNRGFAVELARCQAEKEESKREAARIDAQQDNLQLQDMQIQLARKVEEAARATDELNRFKDMQHAEDAADAAAGRPVFRCTLSDSAARGLQRRDLPYPVSVPPPN